MAYNGSIIVSSKLKPVHSFDLWGVVVDQYVLGQRKIDIYKENAQKKKVPEDEINRVVQDYRDLLDGKSWASGQRKGEIIEAIDGPTLGKEIQRYYASAFIQDALYVIQEILDAGEGVIIFTSEPAPGLKEQFIPDIGERIGEIRCGNKAKPGSFKAVYELESQLGNSVVTHTADELPELVAARKSGLFHPDGLIYVNRNDSNSEDRVGNEGIHCYVDDLRDVKYTTLVINSSFR
jgi:hypothetical protein